MKMRKLLRPIPLRLRKIFHLFAHVGLFGKARGEMRSQAVDDHKLYKQHQIDIYIYYIYQVSANIPLVL